jgi:hypothetical protein
LWTTIRGDLVKREKTLRRNEHHKIKSREREGKYHEWNKLTFSSYLKSINERGIKTSWKKLHFMD